MSDNVLHESTLTKCPACGGTGWTEWDDDELVCETCEGAGFSEVRRYLVEWRRPVKGDFVLDNDEGQPIQCGNNFGHPLWTVVPTDGT